MDTLNGLRSDDGGARRRASIGAFEEHAGGSAGSLVSRGRLVEQLRGRRIIPRDITLLLVAVLVASAVIFALPLGRRPFDNQDEARYSLLARAAVEHGQWILPRVRDEVYLNKPPLYFWTVALFALPFGTVTDATAPIASVVSAVVGLGAVFAIGRLLWGPGAGLAAVVILATSPFYFFMAHQVLTDMMLTAWLSWGLYFYLAAGRMRYAMKPLVAFYLCTAGGLASKGPAALMVVLAALVATVVADGWRGIRRLRLPLGLGLIVLTALPWILLYVLQGERSYGRSVLMKEYVLWYFASSVASRLGALLGHFGRFLPWGFFLLPAAWWWARDRQEGRTRLLVWAGTLAAVLLVSGEQRARYFLPLWPICALLVADFWVNGAERAHLLLARTATVFLGGTIGVAIYVIRGFASGSAAVFLPAGTAERWVLSSALVAGAALALLSLHRQQSGAVAAGCVAAGLGVVLAVTAVGYPPRFARAHDFPGAARRVATRLEAADPLLAYPDASLSWDFYLRRPVRELEDEGEAMALLAAAPRVRLLMRAGDWYRLKRQANPAWRTLDEGQVGRRHFILLGACGSGEVCDP